MSRAKRTVVVLVVVLALYLLVIGSTAVFMLGQPQWSLRLLGIAALVLPLVGIWLVVLELRFGVATDRLAAMLADDPEGEAMVQALPRMASGRVRRGSTDELFALRRAQVEADPDSWQAWFRLAEVYDLAADRSRARAAMRTAIEKADLRGTR